MASWLVECRSVLGNLSAKMYGPPICIAFPESVSVGCLLHLSDLEVRGSAGPAGKLYTRQGSRQPYQLCRSYPYHSFGVCVPSMPMIGQAHAFKLATLETSSFLNSPTTQKRHRGPFLLPLHEAIQSTQLSGEPGNPKVKFKCIIVQQNRPSAGCTPDSPVAHFSSHRSKREAWNQVTAAMK